MMALIIAAEAVFTLPFLVARVFRPTVLEVFGISNTQLGAAFSLYGIVAMISYFPGGPLADRFSARGMMSVALLLTAGGGFYYAAMPPLGGLQFLFGLWGFTTILLFWAALIRATREWGGDDSQGLAFGILDGGRGLFAAVLASVTLVVFGAMLPGDAATATLEQRAAALRAVIWIFTGMTAASAVLVWIFIRDSYSGTSKSPSDADKVKFKSIATVLRNPAVWLQGMIVICAYVSFKATDDFGLYAKDTFGFDDVQAAKIGTVALWVRPIGAFGAGLLGDRIGVSRATTACFLALIAGYGLLALGVLPPTVPVAAYLAIASTGLAIYGLRGVYFALFDEAKVPAALTGTAAGVVSVIGYTPDVFIGPLMGMCTDSFRGPLGHQLFFAVVAWFAILGLNATFIFKWYARRSARAGG
jgi:nitrate/nitrite transporter NarK